MFSDYSEKGAQLNATAENLDNPTPGAVFTSARQRYWSYDAFAKNPTCQPGQLCNRKYGVGFWKSRDIPSAEKNTQMQLGVTQLHTSHPVEQSLSSNLYRQEKPQQPLLSNQGCCPSNCCDRPTGKPFWKINEDHDMLDQYSRNDIAKCYGLSDGDEEKFKACLSQCHPRQWNGWSDSIGFGWN